MIPGKKKDGPPSWHPDFRNTEKLPDIKAVRTDFIINIFAIVLPLLLLVWLAVVELERMSLNASIADLNAQIEERQPENKKLLAQSEKFTDAAKVLTAYNNFHGGSIPPLDIALALTESRPEPVLFSTIVIRDEMERKGKKLIPTQMIEFDGSIDGTAEDPLLVLQEYEAVLRNLPVYADKLDSFTINSRRLGAANSYTFEVLIKLQL